VPTAHESGRECPPFDFQQIEQRASGAKSPATIAIFAATRMASSGLIGVEAETSRRFASSFVTRSASFSRLLATFRAYVSRGSIPGASTLFEEPQTVLLPLLGHLHDLYCGPL